MDLSTESQKTQESESSLSLNRETRKSLTSIQPVRGRTLDMKPREKRQRPGWILAEVISYLTLQSLHHQNWMIRFQLRSNLNQRSNLRSKGWWSLPLRTPSRNSFCRWVNWENLTAIKQERVNDLPVKHNFTFIVSNFECLYWQRRNLENILAFM